MQKKKICIIGLGYIGLPTAALLANKGYIVHGVDIVQSVIDTINCGKIHIAEPDLQQFVENAVKSGKLFADNKPTFADVFIIAVPTPFREGYIPNIDYVIKAAESISPYVKEGNIIILESTSPVGTTEKLEDILGNNGIDISKVYIAYCPERVIPGFIMKELIENDRIVGGKDKESAKIIGNFYRYFVKGEVYETDTKTAEMCKLVENSFRDVNIAFANEISMLCDKLGINVLRLIELANKHPRVNILKPGVGVGGHCIAVDPWFIVYSDSELSKLIRTAREVNNYKTQWVIEKIKNYALKFEKENRLKPKIACLGLAFKPDVDDLRESPALYVVKRLINEGYDVLPVEPNVNNFKDFQLFDIEEAVKKADIITFLVAHKEFKKLNIKTELDFCGVTKYASSCY